MNAEQENRFLIMSMLMGATPRPRPTDAELEQVLVAYRQLVPDYDLTYRSVGKNDAAAWRKWREDATRSGGA